MKKLLGLAIVALLPIAAPARADVVDRIVAQVNNDIITLSDLRREMRQVRQQLSNQYSGDQLENEIKKYEKRVLDNLIQEKLLLQKAAEFGFNANVDVQVSAALDRIRRENNIRDMQEFERALGSQGMTLPGFREEIRKQIITQSLINDFVAGKITLLSSEIEKYYEEHADDFTVPEEVSLSEIVIPVDGTEAQAKSRAEEVHRRLLQGEPFATLASQFSKGPTANKGGSIGSYTLDKLAPDITKAIAGVKAGDMTGVLQTKEGFVIYRVDSRTEAARKPLEDVKSEIQSKLWERKFTPEYERFVARLREEAYIQIFEESK